MRYRLIIRNIGFYLCEIIKYFFLSDRDKTRAELIFYNHKLIDLSLRTHSSRSLMMISYKPFRTRRALIKDCAKHYRLQLQSR